MKNRQHYLCIKARLIAVFWRVSLAFLAGLADWNIIYVYRWLCLSFFFGLFLHVLCNWWQWTQPVYSRQKSLFPISIISAFLSFFMYSYIKMVILEDSFITKNTITAKNKPYYSKFLAVHSSAIEIPEKYDFGWILAIIHLKFY